MTMTKLFALICTALFGCSSTVVSTGYAVAGAGGGAITAGAAGSPAADAGGAPPNGGTGGTAGGSGGSVATGGVPSTGGGPTCLPDSSVCADSCPAGYYKSAGCSDGGAACACGGGPRSQCSDPCKQTKIYVCDNNKQCPLGYTEVQGTEMRDCSCGACLDTRITCILQ
jgi:hypothetical protein